MYMQGISDQTKIFMYAFGFGFVLGILYDVFRIIRLTLSLKKRFIFIQDIIYILICTLLTFLFILVVNKGQIMGYILFGELLGWLIYYFSLGYIAIKVSNKIIKFLRSFFNLLKHVIINPIIFIGRKFKNILLKIFKVSRKKTKKVINKSKFCLKIRANMLYNLKQVMCFKKLRKGKQKNGSNDQEKT